MAEPNRDKFEKKLAKELGQLFSAFSGHLYEALEGAGWSVEDIPPEIWDEFSAEQRRVLLPFLERTSLEWADALMETVSVGVDWSLINEEAAQWARMYSGELISGISQTSQTETMNAIRNSIATFFETDMTLPELERMLAEDPQTAQLFYDDVKDRLGRTFGTNRARMIAITETTRSASQGQIIAGRGIEREGIEIAYIWFTSSDDRVCPICSPLDRVAATTIIDGRPQWEHPRFGMTEEPPAHVNCRCRMGLEFANHEYRTRNNRT